MKTSWWMPIEAVRFHARKPRRIVVVASTDTIGSLDDFRRVLSSLPDVCAEIVEAGSFVGRPNVQLDFGNDLEDILDVVDAIYEKIEEMGEDPARVVVDVTGGTKLCSLAGLAAVQPCPRRCFLYVFAGPGRPASVGRWDVTFELERRSR